MTECEKCGASMELEKVGKNEYFACYRCLEAEGAHKETLRLIASLSRAVATLNSEVKTIKGQAVINANDIETIGREVAELSELASRRGWRL